MVLLWVASDWPMHDISEEYLYSVHMIQHHAHHLCGAHRCCGRAMPEWLARLVLSAATAAPGVWVRRLARPVMAGVLSTSWWR